MNTGKWKNKNRKQTSETFQDKVQVPFGHMEHRKQGGFNN